jgi:hypothetical protein
MRGGKLPKASDINQTREIAMKKTSMFFAGLIVIVVLSSCASTVATVTDWTVRTTEWEIGVAKNFLGDRGSSESAIKPSSEKEMVSDNKAK